VNVGYGFASERFRQLFGVVQGNVSRRRVDVKFWVLQFDLPKGF
jgi:hypothetical protein